MQRYELVDGGSSKFWEVDLAGTELKVTFGRIGTAGQSRNKSFADAASALKEHERLVREKTGKGYVLATGLPVAAPALAPANPSPSTPPPAPAVTASQPAREVPPSSSLRWPEDGVQWNPKWTEQLPVVRGVHAPPPGPVPPWEKGELVVDATGWHFEARLAQLAKEAGAHWKAWTRGAVAQAQLERADRAEWLELLAQLQAGDSRRDRDALAHFCLARHGLAFCVDIALEAWGFIRRANVYGQYPLFLLPIRQAIAASPEHEYLHVRSIAQAALERGEEMRVACAYLFPTEAAWALPLADAKLDPQEAKLARTCVLPPAAFARLLRSDLGCDESVVPCLLLQLWLHGTAALEALEPAIACAREAYWGGAWGGEVFKIIARVRGPGTIRLLLRHLDERRAREPLEKLAAEFPAAVLACAIEQAAQSGDATVQAWAVRLAARQPEALAQALDAVPASARSCYEAHTAHLNRPVAAPEQLPAVLRQPPWLAAQRKELPSFVVAALPTAERMLLDEAQSAEAASAPSPLWGEYLDANGFPASFGLSAAGAAALTQGLPLPEDGLDRWVGRDAMPAQLFLCPPQAQLPLWNSYPGKHWSRWSRDCEVWHVFVKFGFAALPGLLSFFRAHPDYGARLAFHFDSPGLVDWQLHQMRHGKQHRDAAARWVRAFAPTVLFRVLPQAFHPEASAARDTARQAIRWLAQQGLADPARTAAAAYGGPMPQALETFLAMDPLELLPATMPVLPAFVLPGALRRPELRSGGALPEEAVRHVATMLALSTPQAPYAGLAIVRESCTPESLADFAWDLAEAWAGEGAPPKESWAFQGLALLGDDGTARRLVPRIRDWADNGAPARAVAALDVLAAIGTDVALMHLNAFTRQTKWKPLKKRAAEMIAAVAEARGLSEEELGDRLVPTLGLDEDGALELDYGPRQFRVRFDEALAPFITDAQGVRLKAIPRPVKTDDADRAKAAVERYKHIRKEVEGVANLQVGRMERAMVARRRWSAADFRLFFLQHPLMRHLAARLVWSTCVQERPAQTFRIAEDGTLADATDSTWTLPGDASVGLPHVLDLAPEDHAAWTRLFGDYEIAQPFRQLGRETFALTGAERGTDKLARFAGRSVAAVALLALNHRGWVRQSDDGSDFTFCTRELPGGVQAAIFFTPGMPIGDATSVPAQALGEFVLSTRDAQGRTTAVPWGELEPLSASELLRDIHLLAAPRT